MKTIGIKLADGTFYPILQENTPSEKKLDLTTAHNNQTKIMVDLYRSANLSMEDAEYVDSLQIENLVAHPNGEPNISFTISIDEDNKLSAQIIDPETGNQSNTSITLVSRTQEERLTTDEYDITDSDDESLAAGVTAGAGILAAGVAAGAALNADTEDTFGEETAVEVPTDEPVEEEQPVEEPVTEEFSVDDVPTDETITEETVSDDTISDQTFEMPDIDSEISNDETITDEEKTTDETIADETLVQEQEQLTDTFEGDGSEIIIDDEVADEDVPDEDLDMDFSLPEETTTDEASDEVFTAPDEALASNDEDFTAANDDEFFNMDDNLDTTTEAGDSMNNSDEPQAGNGISFTGLYDKETELGESAASSEVEEAVKKKTKIPVIICIICAIICLLATLLVLFVIPSRFNLFCKKTTAETVAITAEKPAEEAPPLKAEPPAPAAKEEEIVVIEKAETVVPEQPPVAEEKAKNITYKIKWGDTLWDIANTYYKNPWRYKYIARYNGIKNPDHIISGTYIIIPAQ